MHPLVARIHPSYRTALVAWLFSRAICWIASLRAGWGAVPLLYAPSYREGAPLWSAWVQLCRSLEGWELWFGAGAGTWAMVAAGELALLVALLAVYRFVRRAELPQTAERAAWLWGLSPAMALTIPVSSWNFAIGALAVALAAVRSQRFLAASAAYALATGFRPEAILLWPGFAWIAYGAYRPGKDEITAIWTASLAPLAGFTATVGGAMLAAGRWGISIRTLHPVASWRTDWVWDGWATEAPAVAVACAAALGLLLALRAVGRDGGRALVAASPALVWPLLHQPALAACGTFALALPVWALLARRLENPSHERPVVVGFVGGLVAWLL